MIQTVLKKIGKWVVKHFWKPFLVPEIEHDKDYMKRIITTIIYSLCFVAGLIVSLLIPSEFKQYPIYTIFFWGIFCSIPFIPKNFMTTFRVAKASYKIGKATTEREYISVTQRDATTYSVNRMKTHEGGAFAFFAVFLMFLGKTMLYALIGHFSLAVKIAFSLASLFTYKKRVLNLKSEANISVED